MYLITGATGHIGNTLIRTLLERDPSTEIRAFVLPDSDLSALTELPVEIMYGNILDPQMVKHAMQDVDVVFHLAAIISIRGDDTSCIEAVNIQGAVNIAEAALNADIKRMVHVASINIFERQSNVRFHEDIPLVTAENATGIYDYTKAEAVRCLRAIGERGLDIVYACPTGVMGPHDYLGSEYGAVIRGYMTNRLQVVLDGGYDWVDVRDIADGLLALAERGTPNELYLLGGHYVSMQDFIDRVGAIMNRTYTLLHMPFSLLMPIAYIAHALSNIFKVHTPLTPYAVRGIRAKVDVSYDKAARTIGYAPRPFSDTLRDTLRWYDEHSMSS